MSYYTPLLTDQYQLVMAQAYWKLGMAEQEAVFHLSFRNNPFQSNYSVTCGLASVIEFLNEFSFSEEDIEYLKTIPNNSQGQLFSNEFLNYLKNLKFSCDVDAIPEGRIVFPKEPLLRIKGPILQCQLLETPIINLIHFPTLVATKASKLLTAAKGDPIIEFGLRRAQGPDGGLTASRAAYVGGCVSTSNVLAGKKFNIPIQGTQAHSWIMAFPDELTAFSAFSDVMKSHCVLLVDTYNTLQGVKNAIVIGKQLREKGEQLAGIRLDSGDLLELSRQSRKILDDAGFQDTKIIASGDLDVDIIHHLKEQKAPIDAWGVGTRLCTSYDQPALNAIYKLAAIKNNHGGWDYKMKISDQPDKMTFPGIQQVRRFYKNKCLVTDIIFELENGTTDLTTDFEDLLIPIFKNGKLMYQTPPISKIREYCIQEVHSFVERFNSEYPVLIDKKLQQLQANLIKQHGK